MFYTSRTAFNAANPGLPVEDFEEARLATGTAVRIASPLNSSTSNSVFSPGDILPGLGVASLLVSGSSALVAVGPGVLTGTSKMIGDVRQFPQDDALLLLFNPGVASVGAALFLAKSPGNSVARTVFITAFGPLVNGDLPLTGLGSTSVDLAAVSGGFFGVRSSDPIFAITIGSNVDSNLSGFSEFVDNIAFGNPVASENFSVVPEPTTAGMLA